MKSDGLEQLANLSRLIKKYIIFKEKKKQMKKRARKHPKEKNCKLKKKKDLSDGRCYDHNIFL